MVMKMRSEIIAIIEKFAGQAVEHGIESDSAAFIDFKDDFLIITVYIYSLSNTISVVCHPVQNQSIILIRCSFTATNVALLDSELRFHGRFGIGCEDCVALRLLRRGQRYEIHIGFLAD
jgi:hypothetical protein